MGALKINCYCDEDQMNCLVDQIINHINISDVWSLSDIDQPFDNLMISVRFDVFMNMVRLKNAEVLDADWDLLYEDSAVLTSRLKSFLNDYNVMNRLSNLQAKQIKLEQTQN